MEIITGVERRRRWSAAEKLRIVGSHQFLIFSVHFGSKRLLAGIGIGAVRGQGLALSEPAHEIMACLAALQTTGAMRFIEFVRPDHMSARLAAALLSAASGDAILLLATTPTIVDLLDDQFDWEAPALYGPPGGSA